MKKLKVKYWIFTILSFVLSAVPPVVAVLQKFPIWAEKINPTYTIGIGAVLAVIVILICFRKTLIPVIKEKIGIKSIPPVFIWVAGLATVIVFEKINTFMTDIKVVVFAGLVGSALGWICSFVSSFYDKKIKEVSGKNGSD